MADAMIPWLPDRHLSVAATLAHTDELIEQVGNLLFEYQVQSGEVIELREEKIGEVNRAVVAQIRPLPRKVPLLVADAFVSLRGAIEHVLFAEVEFLNGGPLDEGLAHKIEMPAKQTFEAFDAWAQNRPRRLPASFRTGGELLRRISGLQPFQKNHRPETHPLARLVSYTNHAKHRNPAVTALKLAAVLRDDEVPRSPRDIPARFDGPLRVGDLVAEAPLGAVVPLRLFPTIGINRPGTEEWPILMRELEEISTWVRTQAIPRLVTGGDPPSPDLPARYTITIGHKNERNAISNGAQMAAADLFQNRLKAEMIRQELPVWLSQLPGELDYEAASTWMAQLSDLEVIERMGRIPHVDSPSQASRTAAAVALLELAEEAALFSKGLDGKREVRGGNPPHTS